MPGDQSNFARVAWILASTLIVFLLWLALNAAAGPGLGFFYAIPVGLTTWWFGVPLGHRRRRRLRPRLLLRHPARSGRPPRTRARPPGHRFRDRARRRLRPPRAPDRARALRRGTRSDPRRAHPRRAPRTCSGVDVGAAFSPSEYGVSGDFYLLTNGPDNSTIAIVGDVVGHGPKAARLATFVRARFAAFAVNTSDPAEILALANAALIEDHGPDEEIVSAICLRYRPEDSSVCWALAGHPPPLRLPHLREMKPAGETMLLGVRERLDLTATEVQLSTPDDGVLVYTDGATDVRREDALLGLDGLARLLTPLAKLPAPAFVGEAQRLLLEWADKPIGDDLCLLALRPKPDAA